MTNNVIITGTITCPQGDIAMFQEAVKTHIALSNAEAGCMRFSITPDDGNPYLFHVDECFTDQAAFDIHTKRTRASEWWDLTKHIPRDLTIA